MHGGGGGRLETGNTAREESLPANMAREESLLADNICKRVLCESDGTMAEPARRVSARLLGTMDRWRTCVCAYVLACMSTRVYGCLCGHVPVYLCRVHLCLLC